MVLPKRTLGNGLLGYNAATNIPKARRSVRRRGLCPNTREGGQLCAFELLATVAGKLLEESTECSSASSSAALRFVQHEIKQGAIKKEIQDVDKPLGGEHDEQGSSEGSVFFSDIQREISRRKLETVSEKIGEHAPPISSLANSNKVDSDSQLFIQESDDGILKSATNLDKGINRQLNINVDTNTEEKVKLPLCADSNPNNASFLKRHENHVRKGCKDDDEILSRYSQPNNTIKAYRSSTHFADRKNNLLTSKCWKTAPKLKDYEPSNMGAAAKHAYHNKRSHCDLDRSQRNTPIKKRKLFDRSSIVTCDGGISCESVSNSPEKSVDEKKASARQLHEGNRKPSSEFEHQESCSFGTPHVRLTINSFEIPELFIDVPESTTIGSLKRTVLEAVTSILSGGLRVGILVQGEKIRDDNKTLLQTNLSQNDDSTDTIAFMLEPNSPTYSEDAPIPLSCESPKFVNRSQVHVNEDMYLLDTLDKPCMTDSNSPVGSGGDLVLSPTTELDDKHVSDSKALVTLPEERMEPLAFVPVNQRLKRCEIGHRRTRRPFSVTEVEALVHAVEKLGTGRWRDVKLCSFENEKHRTYVDLKDKWKTLVHTARISPQQRRGEPVPQELLDRVLATQTYWSDHQAKQHGKHQQAIIPKLDSPAVKA